MHLPSYDCVLYPNNHVESLLHLFFDCPFARSWWQNIGIAIHSTTSVEFTVEICKEDIQLPFAIEVVILSCWSIWTVRNNHFFNGLTPSLASCKENFKTEFALLIYRTKASYSPLINNWFDSVVDLL
ncbi:hypothetical protein BS78_02G147000 [Paspalum vaginatum]|nr:hypothetical protein BS78_02G147000 [Paspalum vaginatum]